MKYSVVSHLVKSGLLALLLAVPLGCAGSDDSEDSDDTTGEDDTSSDGGGEAFFKSTCSTCHGVDGKGVPTLGPPLRFPVPDYFEWVVRNGRSAGLHGEYAGSAMVAYSASDLSDAAISEIIDYLNADPQPTDGGQLYRYYCSACHGANATGPSPVNKSLIGVPEAEVRSTIRSGNGGQNYANRESFMPKYDPSALSDADVDAIVDFLAGL